MPSKWSGWTGRGLPDATRTRAISAVVFAHARKMGLECIVSDSAYRSGRSPDSLEMKNSNAPAVKREEEEDWAKRNGNERTNGLARFGDRERPRPKIVPRRQVARP